MNNLLVIRPYEIVTFISLIVLLFLLSLFLIAKHEKGSNYFIWLLIIVFIPVIGSVAYVIKWITGKTQQQAIE